MTRVVIWVQHLLGTGHTVRAAAIGRALAARGAEVTLVLGAVPPPTLTLDGLRTVQLEPVLATDATFTTLRTADGRSYADVAGERAAAFAAAVARAAPDVLLLETFPLGRRAFRAEIDPVLRALPAPRPVVATSVRDVLVRKSPVKAAEMAELARRTADLVLVHADPRFVTLADSFPAANLIEDRIRYTGFVHGAAAAPSADAGPGEGTGETIVSCGGGAVGQALVEAAIGAAAYDTATAWRILVPQGLAAHLPAWRAAAGGNVLLEPNRPDFRVLLGRAALSVSQAGYNTALDVLAAGVRAIFVPFAAHDETEQTDRARALAARDLAAVIAEADLTPGRLAAMVAAAKAAPPPDRPDIDLDGADHAAAILMEVARCRR
ncbi:glycosyltransferase family protein [Acuticoccus sp. I52.16.1]|uniref:glycosyltransferase family protein n=1 Tax=Acuticoccus sp. I52.16.1 TaxID=2928472 RepID=UPI001FD5947E|nr:glycosyltransferase [Acuticoccus sp. I52.16.1]UOM33453.1 glycosyltransferase [Acuticoccus sp. I52.16.1]